MNRASAWRLAARFAGVAVPGAVLLLVSLGAAAHVPEEDLEALRTWTDRLFLAGSLAWFLVVLGGGRAALEPGRRLSPVDGFVLMLLTGLLAWRSVGMALEASDGCFIRVMYLRILPFDDPAHPFLPFLLGRPAAWLSLEPWAVRMVPFVFLCLLVWLLADTAARHGGRLAAVLAGSWFLCQVRMRRGLADVSDFDVGAAFLVAALLWTQRRDAAADGKRPATWQLALFLLGACFSDWMAIVPAAVLVLLLGLEARRGRFPGRHVAVLAAVLLVPAALLAEAFTRFAVQPKPWGWEHMLEGFLLETPLQRSAWMAIPLVAGAWAFLTGWRKSLPVRFAGASFLLVAIAVTAQFWAIHRAQGYYVAIVSPFLPWFAALGTAQAARMELDGIGLPGAGDRWTRPARILVGVAVALLFAGTLSLPRWTPLALGGFPEMARFDDLARGDDNPIFTNEPLAYERGMGLDRARRDLGPIEDVYRGPADVRQRLAGLEGPACSWTPSWPPRPDRGFYVVVVGSPDLAGCRIPDGFACERLFGATATAGAGKPLPLREAPMSQFQYFRCTPAGA